MYMVAKRRDTFAGHPRITQTESFANEVFLLVLVLPVVQLVLAERIVVLPVVQNP